MAKRRFHWSTVFDCVMQETDENGDTIVRYTHEPAQFGPLLSENRDGAESYHHYDALGTTTMLTDDVGDVTDTFTLDAWGNQVARTGTTETPYTWVGRWGYQDDSATTGGFYIRARSYQPTVSRWISVDPDQFEEGPNLFSYVANCPGNRTDPLGTQEIPPPPALPCCADNDPWPGNDFRYYCIHPRCPVPECECCPYDGPNPCPEIESKEIPVANRCPKDFPIELAFDPMLLPNKRNKWCVKPCKPSRNGRCFDDCPQEILSEKERKQCAPDIGLKRKVCKLHFNRKNIVSVPGCFCGSVAFLLV